MQPSIDQNKCQSKELFVESERCAVVLRKDVVNVSGKGVFIQTVTLPITFGRLADCVKPIVPPLGIAIWLKLTNLLICLKFSVLLGAPVSVVLRLKLFS